MTNSFVDYLARFEFLDTKPEQAWEMFCESNYARQVQIIHQYASDAFDAGAHREYDNGRIHFSFEDWKNSTE